MTRPTAALVRRAASLGVAAVRAAPIVVQDVAAVVIHTFRDSLRQWSPPWLQRGHAEKIGYSMGVQVDAFGDALVAGVKLRFPGYYTMDALSLTTLGRERRIPRGRTESDASYAARLATFFDAHRYRGGPSSLLEQWWLYWRPDMPATELVYANGPRYTVDPATGAITRDVIAWYPGPDPAMWARWWMFLSTDRWASAPPTASEVAELRRIPRQWNAAHTLGSIVIMSPGAELWNWPLGRRWNGPGVWNTTGKVWVIAIDSDVGVVPGEVAA
jgi:hypothetical protein